MKRNPSAITNHSYEDPPPHCMIDSSDEDSLSSSSSPTARRRRRAALWGSLSLFLFNTVALLTFHVVTAKKASKADDAPPSTSSATTDFPVFSALDKILFGVLVLMAFELLDFLTKNSGKWLHSPLIPVRGKHLDDLRPIDTLFIGFSKANTAPFTYFFLRFCWTHCPWDFSQITILNTLLPIPCLYILFDLTYWMLHCFLHIQSLYPLIHKHHHIQKAPSRANVDAVNVHPIEFVLGEYNHLLTAWFWTAVLQWELHVVGALVFLAAGGVLAGINHTRFDVTLAVPIPARWWKGKAVASKQTAAEGDSQHWTYLTVFDSKAHDVHHRIPQSNYGQYTMFWDYVFGTYRPYNPNDRVNPDAQLDPKTGKTIVKAGKAQ